MIIAFAENFDHDDENILSVGPPKPFLYEDDVEFPPLNPLKEGWQMVDDDNAFAHELVQEADDWESVTKSSTKPILLAPLYVEIASKETMTHDSKVTKSQTAEETLPDRIRRRQSSMVSNVTLAGDPPSLDLDLHGQYKSPRRRHRRSMYMNASMKQHPHYRAALRSQIQTAPCASENTPSKTKRSRTYKTIKKTTTGESKLALVEQGLDWAVCH